MLNLNLPPSPRQAYMYMKLCSNVLKNFFIIGVEITCDPVTVGRRRLGLVQILAYMFMIHENIGEPYDL
jgi:hypothetical protein